MGEKVEVEVNCLNCGDGDRCSRTGAVCIIAMLRVRTDEIIQTVSSGARLAECMDDGEPYILESKAATLVQMERAASAY